MTNKIEIGANYVHKVQPVMEILEHQPMTVNGDNEVTFAGVVKFKNHVGAECVMTERQFLDMYQEVK